MASYRCETCNGTGIDPDRAQQSLAMAGLNAYIAAMYPCADCDGDGIDHTARQIAFLTQNRASR